MGCTGHGLRDVHAPKERLHPVFRALLSPELREEMPASRQIEALGYDPRDVQHIAGAAPPRLRVVR